MHFCRPVILCAHRLLRFPEGLSHSFQSFLPSFRAFNFMCRPVTHCAGLLPSLQICLLPFLQTSYPQCSSFCPTFRPVTFYAGLVSSMQACYPPVCLLGSLYACYPLCKPVYPLFRPVYPLFKLFSLFRPILYRLCSPVILSAGLPVVPVVNSVDYMKNSNC